MKKNEYFQKNISKKNHFVCFISKFLFFLRIKNIFLELWFKLFYKKSFLNFDKKN